MAVGTLQRISEGSKKVPVDLCGVSRGSSKSQACVKGIPGGCKEYQEVSGALRGVLGGFRASHGVQRTLGRFEKLRGFQGVPEGLKDVSMGFKEVPVDLETF